MRNRCRRDWKRAGRQSVALLTALSVFSACTATAPRISPAERDAISVFVDREFIHDGSLDTRVLFYEPHVTAELERLTRELAAVAKLETVPQVRVINTTEINAFADDPRYIYVTTGLLERVENRDELAGIIAHEVAHSADHDLHSLLYQRSATWSWGNRAIWVVVAVSTGIGVAAYFLMSSAFPSNGAEEAAISSNPGLKAAVAVSTALGAAALGLAAASVGMIPGTKLGLEMRDVSRQGYSAEDEGRADQRAVEYLSQARYDPTALSAILNRLGACSKAPKAISGESYPTHLGCGRLKRLDKAIKEPPTS